MVCAGAWAGAAPGTAPDQAPTAASRSRPRAPPATLPDLTTVRGTLVPAVAIGTGLLCPPDVATLIEAVQGHDPYSALR